jgi:hypothetical protein
VKYIAPIAVITVVLLLATGAVPQSSVGGAMTLVLVFLLAALAVGIYDAWANKRGALGWIVSIVAALAGAFLGAGAGSMGMEKIFMHTHMEGSLAATGGVALYAAAAGMMLLTLLGSWIALWLVNRMR